MTFQRMTVEKTRIRLQIYKLGWSDWVQNFQTILTFLSNNLKGQNVNHYIN